MLLFRATEREYKNFTKMNNEFLLRVKAATKSSFNTFPMNHVVSGSWHARQSVLMVISKLTVHPCVK